MTERFEDTVAYYNRNAARFAADTADLDMSALYDRFLRYLPPGGRILDAGCGVGRDALAFAERGYSVVAVDASAEMVRLARKRVGSRAEVRLMRFEDLKWRSEFDGIWTCASLLHVPPAAFQGVASRLVGALQPVGVWYMSFKLGLGKRVADGRIFIDHIDETLHTALAGVPVELVEAWTSEDVRLGRGGERWLNAIAQKR